MEVERHDRPDMLPDVPSPLALASAGYPHVHGASKLRMQGGNSNGMSGGGSSNGMEMHVPSVQELAKARKPVRYRECLKNHAAGLGGHALDGCGEFMPSGEEGTLEALKCAACECHRNFHRREVQGEGKHHTMIRFGHLQLPPPLPRPPVLMAPGGRSESDQEQEGDGGLFSPPLMMPPPHHLDSSGSCLLRKRFRTKFTAQQKDRMWELSQKLGWRIQKHDEPAVQHFCAEVGVKRHVLKVWMHNNKSTLAKKPASLSDHPPLLQFSPPTTIP